MAKFTVTKPVNFRWRGNDIIAQAGETARIPDALYDDFLAEFVTGKDTTGPGYAFPGLTWVVQDEATATGGHPDLATHDTLGLATDAELAAHAAAGDPHSTYALDADLANHEAAADPHTGYQKESEKGSASGYASLDGSTLVPVAQIGSGAADTTKFLRGDRSWQTPPGGGGAPIDADYLVGTANGTLSNEIVVGATPGGELGGTWGSPTVDASHSGSTHAGLPVEIIVAATDSPANMQAAADYTCDGVADDVQIQAAIDALPTLGGTVLLAPGTFTLAATVTITANKRIRILGYGAKVNLAANLTAFKVSQGIASARGVRIEGFRIDGQSNTATAGVEFEDTNNSELLGVSIENCVTGIILDSQATNSFVEGSLIDNCLLRDNTTGVLFTITNGTGSFMQTIIRGLRCVVGASGTGMVIPQNALMLRAIIQANFWLDSNETGITIDGNMEDCQLDIGVEGAGGATGNVAVSFGANGTNLDQLYFILKLTGTINTQISNSSSKTFRYMAGALSKVDTTGTVVDGWRRHGDTANRTQLENLTAGGKISFGPGNAAVDTNIYRSAANVLSTDDKFDPASLNLQLKAGTPVDGDVTGGAADGDAIYDSTNKLWYVRTGGTWTTKDHAQSHVIDGSDHTKTGLTSGQIFQATGTASFAFGTLAFSVGALLQGSPPANGFRMVWRAPFACTVTNVRSHFDAGTNIVVNARRNQTSNFLAADRTNSTANAWDDAGAVQNTAIAAGDDIEVNLVSTSGAVTAANIQVDLTRP